MVEEWRDTSIHGLQRRSVDRLQSGGHLEAARELTFWGGMLFPSLSRTSIRTAAAISVRKNSIAIGAHGVTFVSMVGVAILCGEQKPKLRACGVSRPSCDRCRELDLTSCNGGRSARVGQGRQWRPCSPLKLQSGSHTSNVEDSETRLAYISKNDQLYGTVHGCTV